MLINRVHLYLNQMGVLLILPITVHMNEYYIVEYPIFSEVSNNARVHINMDTSKEKFTNVLIKERNIIHFKAYAEGLFHKNLDKESMTTNTGNVSVNAYYYLSNIKNLIFLVILKLKERGKFGNCRNICTGQEHHIFKTYLHKGMIRN